jgi:hypothetical protein
MQPVPVRACEAAFRSLVTAKCCALAVKMIQTFRELGSNRDLLDAVDQFADLLHLIRGHPRRQAARGAKTYYIGAPGTDRSLNRLVARRSRTSVHRDPG